MERSEIRDRRSGLAVLPGLRFASSGLRIIVVAFQGRLVLNKSVRCLAALVALSVIGSPALAAESVRIGIGIGYGLAFLPLYICEDLKLVEKQAKALHLDVKASYQRLPGAGPMQEAIAAGDIDMAPFGTAPLLAAWEQTKDTPAQIIAVSGLTTMPLVLLSNQPNVAALGDLQPGDRIAMASLTAPQMYLLEMQSEKIFHQYDRLRDQVVALPAADAIDALVGSDGAVTAFFSSPPFTQLALRDAKVHAVLTSSEVMNGKATFLMLGATRGTVEAHPQIVEAVGKAIDEAARIIRDDPRRAAQIYLTHEPSQTVDGSTAAAVLKEIGGEFGSTLYGVQTFADFMGRHGELKNPPKSWKDIVAPALLNSPST
jgi:NitT/TauT family transport system substrate-binding protein